MAKQKIVIATRESPLAMWQARHVAQEIESRCPGFSTELLGMTTTGDQQLATSLSKIGGKGLFVKELETALMDGRADLAVHSGKDVPMQLPLGMELAVIDSREDPRDALILPSATSRTQGVPLIDSLEALVSMLPDGAVIGTSSLRRKAQLQALCQGRRFVIRDLRGNLNTRLKKLDDGEYDAIILAAAGMKRLGWEHRISAYFTVGSMLPAVAQGALAVEYQQSRREYLHPVLDALVQHETRLCVAAERAFNYTLQGSCQVPIAAHAELAQDHLSMRGLVAAVDGSELLEENSAVALGATDPDQQIQLAESIGQNLADKLLARGARRILDQALG